VISTVAVGTDGSDTAAKAVEYAAEMARRFDAELVLISAFGKKVAPSDSKSEAQWAHNKAAVVRELLSRTEAELNGKGVRCRTAVDEGDPAEVLVRLADECDADVLVIGNQGMKRRMLGSVPNSVTHKADCAVLVVKTD
jgi:nucleotide-binding universal stress UspA family protein